MSDVLPRIAAAVVVVRENPIVEVLMVRRPVTSEFCASVYVFPGGSVDADDYGDHWGRYLVPRSERGDCGAGGAGVPFPDWLGVAAVREVFEETGILIGSEGEDSLVGPSSHDNGEMASGAVRNLRMHLVERSSCVSLSRLRYFQRWITPAGMPRRFDTHFFLCRGQTSDIAVVDTAELVDAAWVSPKSAVALHSAGAWPLVPVTLRQLSFLAQFSSLADLWHYASTLSEVPVSLPRLEYDAGGVARGVWFPGESAYETLESSIVAKVLPK